MPKPITTERYILTCHGLGGGTVFKRSFAWDSVNLLVEKPADEVRISTLKQKLLWIVVLKMPFKHPIDDHTPTGLYFSSAPFLMPFTAAIATCSGASAYDDRFRWRRRSAYFFQFSGNDV